MDAALGVGLLGLTLYASILSYAVRGYSRKRLSDELSPTQQRIWFERLDQQEGSLQLVASTFRLISILLLASYVYYSYDRIVYAGASSPPRDALNFLAPPAITLLVLLVFALGVPNAVAAYAGEAVLARSLRILWIMRILMWPIERMLIAVDFIVRRLLGQSEESEEEENARVEQEILEAVNEGELHGAVDEEQKEMIRSVFELGETTVSEIMTPRTEITALPVTCTFEEARETILRAGHSRIPVYQETLDHILGVLYAKDLLREGPRPDFDVSKVMRLVPFVPETKPLDALLDDFRSTKVQIAIVLDEYGGTAGLCTIEDILEELVGEIDDEYDQKPPPAMERIDETTLDVDARVHVSEINEELGVSLPEDEDYDTIGGFVFSTLGKIPTQGEEFTHEGLQFRVMDAEPRKIKRLRIQVTQQQEQEV